MGQIKLFARLALFTLLFVGCFTLTSESVQAASYGVHVLGPGELHQVAQEFHDTRIEDDPVYVTVPFTLADIDKLSEWQRAFDIAEKENIIPLVRITTRFEPSRNAWEVPTRREMIAIVNALNDLDWPQKKRHVILFNEPNHAAEWNGEVNPAQFAATSIFLADWFKTEEAEYVLLPAAADLAAANTDKTWEAFRFWREVIAAQPEFFDRFDAWNSHSYPNPGFTGLPTARGQNSLRGFEHELVFLEQHTDKEWDVYITETGWRETPQNRIRLLSYYQTAHKTVWEHDQVIAVTPFVWRGSPGPFAEFSFLDANAQPTAQWHAFARVLQDRARQLVTQKN